MVMGCEMLGKESLERSAASTLTLVRESVSYMDETLRDVMDIQKVDEGVLLMNFISFEVDDFVKSVLIRYSERIEQKAINVEVLVRSTHHCRFSIIFIYIFPYIVADYVGCP